MKPIGSAQGKGIFLFTRLSEISDWKTDFKYKPGNGIDGIPLNHLFDLLGSENVLKYLPKKIHPPIKDRKDLPLKQKELGANLKVEIA